MRAVALCSLKTVAYSCGAVPAFHRASRASRQRIAFCLQLRTDKDRSPFADRPKKVHPRSRSATAKIFVGPDASHRIKRTNGRCVSHAKMDKRFQPLAKKQDGLFLCFENRHRHSLRGRFESMCNWSVSWLASRRIEAAFPVHRCTSGLFASLLHAYSGGGRSGFTPDSHATPSP